MEKHYSELHSRNQNQRIKIHCMGIIGMTRAILVCVLFKTCDHTVPSIGCVTEHKAFTMCSLMLSLIQNIRANWCQPLSHIPAVNSSCHVCSHSQKFREGVVSQTSVSLTAPTAQPVALFTLTGGMFFNVPFKWGWNFIIISFELMNGGKL